MHPAAVTLAISVFLSGAVTVVFVMLVASIRSGDHRRLTVAPDSRLEALTRTILGVGIRTRPPGRSTGSEVN